MPRVFLPPKRTLSETVQNTTMVLDPVEITKSPKRRGKVKPVAENTNE
jgi:hypothetical protein